MKNKLYRVNKQNKFKRLVEIFKTYSFIFSIGFCLIFSYLKEFRKAKKLINNKISEKIKVNTKYTTNNLLKLNYINTK